MISSFSNSESISTRLLPVDVFLSADQEHHLQIDADESPNLPRQEGAHEERKAGRLRCVDIGVYRSGADAI